MQKKRTFFFILVLACLFAIFLFYFEKNQHLQESITYFPDDSALHYQSAETTLSMAARPAVKLSWQVESAVNKKVYLRQDLSLLYRNNRLYAIMNHWQTRTALLSQKKQFSPAAGLYEALSIHHAERHRNDLILGKDKLSSDAIIIENSAGEWSAFKKPGSEEQSQRQKIYTERMRQERQTILKRAASIYHLDLSRFHKMALIDLPLGNEPIAGFDQKTTHRVISQLWEGLYKNMVFGIRMGPHETINPVNSAMPLLLIDKKQRQLFVIIETSGGKIAMLRQSI